uniref:Ribosomal protein S23 mitochondrial conserved domain-containing protein n=1 Tax=Panagrolaimus sp. ES5 TaxID=591445 RepID=A0AC34GK94_9BILA
MYKEDMIRARFYSEFRNSGVTAVENSTKSTLCEQFIQQIEDERKANPKMTEDQLFERAINVLNERGILKKPFGVSFCRFTDDRIVQMLEQSKEENQKVEFRNSGGENLTKPTLCEQFIQQIEDERKANPK